MIATMKVLGLRAASPGALTAAAFQVVDYLERGTEGPRDGQQAAAEVESAGLAGYFDPGTDAGTETGTETDIEAGIEAGGGAIGGASEARGRAAGRGDRGSVAPGAGRAALRHRPTMLPAGGSAGARPARRPQRDGAEMLSLAEAARLAGVSPQYLHDALPDLESVQVL